MAKVCKFCNHDNDEALEFCEQCGAKLPIFHRLVVDENRKPKKHIKINFVLIFFILVVLFLLYCLYLAFCPFLPEDKLPPYRESYQGARRIIASIRHIPDETEHFNVAIYVEPEALSLYLTSLGKPAVLEKKYYDDDIIPRLLIDFPKDEPKMFVLVHRNKMLGMHVRTEFVFRQHDNEEKWFIDSCKFGKLPMSWFSKKMLSSVLVDYARHSDMKKILKSELKIKRKGAYVDISLKYDKKESFGKIKGFLSGLFGKTKEVVGKAAERVTGQE